MNRVLALLFLVAFLLVSCGSPATPKSSNPNAQNIGDTRTVFQVDSSDMVCRFEDKEADVVCWIFVGGQQGGLTCLPRSQTKLGY